LAAGVPPLATVDYGMAAERDHRIRLRLAEAAFGLSTALRQAADSDLFWDRLQASTDSLQERPLSNHRVPRLPRADRLPDP